MWGAASTASSQNGFGETFFVHRYQSQALREAIQENTFGLETRGAFAARLSGCSLKAALAAGLQNIGAKRLKTVL